MITIMPNTCMLLLLLLSRFSRVQLCATPETAAHQAPLSLGFSRQEHWSGLPFPSPMHESEKWSEVAQLCPTLSDPMDYSLPGSPIPGILKARVPELVAFILKDYLNTYFLCEDYPGISLPRQSTIFSSVFGKYWSQCPQCINSDWHTHKSINTYLLTEWRKNSSEEEK